VGAEGPSGGTPAGLLAHRGGDHVAVAVRNLTPGVVAVGFLDGSDPTSVEVLSEVPLGHKVALDDLGPGQPVIEYGERIGLTTQAVRKGEHVHVHNLRSAKWQAAS
jgi:(2R)-sulfolactate sulfo-lyase subunit alpha